MNNIPLAEKLRPKNLDEFIGQDHLVGKTGIIRKILQTGKIPSMIFWGPPGCGKTTLAKLISQYINADFIPFSAVETKINKIKEIIKKSKEKDLFSEKQTIIFIDEIHRLSKAQQDAFLPHIENGTIILIAATTENPGFEIIAPLLSRCQLYILYPLKDEEIKKIIEKALRLYPDHIIKEEAIEYLINYSHGDARTCLNALEIALSLSRKIDKETIENALQQKSVFYDKDGDNHYDTISAFIKSMRGGDPDATIHYLARMIKAGEDPIFIARRMVIFASEDIGNAQPTALVVATSAMQAVQMIGMPEATLILAQTATYLATAKKSIASTVAIQKALDDLEKINPDPIPLHLRNPKNKIMKNLGYGKNHIRYPWLIERETGKKPNQDYMPKNLKGRKYYIIDWK